MVFSMRICEVFIILITVLVVRECAKNIPKKLDKKYYLATAAYDAAYEFFMSGKSNYVNLKEKALKSMDIFFELVYIINEEMARTLRSAVIKFYKIQYFRDFTNYIISMEEITDIVNHCLKDPEMKLVETRTHFHEVIKNFQDSRNFETVNKCLDVLPDEVAATHCILHQAMLFNETMQETLSTIVVIKTRHFAQDLNTSICSVQKCLQDFVPQFFENLLTDAYSRGCGYLSVVNASMSDIVKEKWKSNQTFFLDKWGPVVTLLKTKNAKVLSDCEIPSYKFANVKVKKKLLKMNKCCRMPKGYVTATQKLVKINTCNGIERPVSA